MQDLELEWAKRIAKRVRQDNRANPKQLTNVWKQMAHPDYQAYFNEGLLQNMHTLDAHKYARDQILQQQANMLAGGQYDDN